MFSRTERCGSSACRRSAGTSTTPARIASYGCRALQRLARRRGSRRRSARAAPASASKSSSWPWPSSAAMPRISPGAQRERDAAATPRRPRGRSTSSAGAPRRLPALGARVAPASALDRGADRLRGRLAEHVLDDRLLAALLRDDRARPRRRRAGSSRGRRSAITSLRRCVMKSTERPRSRRRAHHREHALGEVGRQRGGDLVEQQQLRVARERAREVDHAQQRQRHVADELARSRRRGPSRAARARTAPASAPVRRRFCADGQVGHERGILEDGREPDPRRAAPASRCAPALPLTVIVPRSARITPVRILTSVLLPAPFAPSSACTSPGSTTRSAERSATAPGRSSWRGRGLREVRPWSAHGA